MPRTCLKPVLPRSASGAVPSCAGSCTISSSCSRPISPRLWWMKRWSAIPVLNWTSCSDLKIGFRRGTFLRGFMYDFIELFAPHLTKTVVDEAVERHTRSELDELFRSQDRLPARYLPARVHVRFHRAVRAPSHQDCGG